MSKQETLEGNKLIAEFLNDKIILEEDGICIISGSKMWFSGNKRLEQYQEKCYHSSWDWLMPCIGKIGSIDYSSVDIHWGTGATDSFAWCKIYWNDGVREFKTSNDLNSDEQSLITAVWRAVVEFIKWYNLCQKEK